MPFRLGGWDRKPAKRRPPADRAARLEPLTDAEKLAADARRRKAALSGFQDHDTLDLPAGTPRELD